MTGTSATATLRRRHGRRSAHLRSPRAPYPDPTPRGRSENRRPVQKQLEVVVDGGSRVSWRSGCATRTGRQRGWAKVKNRAYWRYPYEMAAMENRTYRPPRLAV